MIIKNNVLIIDIETVAQVPDLIREKRIEKLQPRKGTKDVEKIKVQLQEKIDAIEEKAALSPITGKVIAVGLCIKGSHDEDWTSKVLVDDDESVLLKCALDEISRINPIKFITFNGRKFDFPFLSVRCALHQLSADYKWPLNYSPLHLDLYDSLGEGSLEDWGILLTGRGKSSQGSEIAKLYQDKNWPEIEKHCLEDLQITALLYDRLSSVAELTRR